MVTLWFIKIINFSYEKYYTIIIKIYTVGEDGVVFSWNFFVLSWITSYVLRSLLLVPKKGRGYCYLSGKKSFRETSDTQLGNSVDLWSRKLFGNIEDERGARSLTSYPRDTRYEKGVLAINTNLSLARIILHIDKREIYTRISCIFERNRALLCGIKKRDIRILPTISLF